MVNAGTGSVHFINEIACLGGVSGPACAGEVALGLAATDTTLHVREMEKWICFTRHRLAQLQSGTNSRFGLECKSRTQKMRRNSCGLTAFILRRCRRAQAPGPDHVCQQNEFGESLYRVWFGEKRVDAQFV